MAENHPPTAADEFAESKSSIYRKLPTDLRKDLDSAIVNYDQRSYRECFRLYRLADYRVSFTAFYFYARRLRSRASVAHLAGLVGQNEDKLIQAMPDLINHRLADALLAHDAEPLEIQRLARSVQLAIRNQTDRVKLERLKNPSAAPTRSSRYRGDDGYDHTAPYGRKKDGTPNERAEFLRDLRRGVRDIYGLDLDVDAIERSRYGVYGYNPPFPPGESPATRSPADQPPSESSEQTPAAPDDGAAGIT